MEKPLELTARVERDIEQGQWLQPGDGIVVAVSGGPDSVALLHLLFALSEKWSWRLTAAHVNHGFRPEESALEAELVRRTAEKLGVAYEAVTLDLPDYIRRTGMNGQAAAREKRYEFLHRVALHRGASRVALAHHADDQAETVLMRILRGTGPSGLRGIPVHRMEKNGVELIRPLLRITKVDLVRYCEERKLAYATDSSNLKADYYRNQIRLEALPYLSQYNERLPSALTRLAEMMEAEDDYMEAETGRLYERNVTAGSDGHSWSARWFAGVHVALQRRLIKLILNYLACGEDALDFLKIEQIRLAVLRERPSNFQMDIGLGIRLTREYDRTALHSMVLPPVPFAHEVPPELERLDIPESGASMTFRTEELRQPYEAGDDRLEIWLDAAAVPFPLTIRSRRPGDRMRLFGLNGSKKVKDMFIDAKLPPGLRDRVPLVADAEGRILWAAGIRRSSVAPVTESTRSVLRLRLFMPDLSRFACQDT
ncbi:tRNA lysidine(34) synthetase TilS [Paenibacillus filicis]|uniref:tRNA(Ile)-lysidine synthase n=1 Tax=Paenibacillus gyeongsangnamensis TaxID=3388067 RepID=A0ABT4QLI9_9BACL|nr:tRNA lysidine(34) synthetase TilS [Paenibacillus filicis]MCZ8517585.1 tRNA lysidine(34) synthetase TilS [Paenibacillus filicis]